MLIVQSLSSFLTKWIMFPQDQFVSESVPFGVKTVSGSCSTHHLHQDSPQRRKTVNTMNQHVLCWNSFIRAHKTFSFKSTYFALLLATGIEKNRLREQLEINHNTWIVN